MKEKLNKFRKLPRKLNVHLIPGKARARNDAVRRPQAAPVNKHGMKIPEKKILFVRT